MKKTPLFVALIAFSVAGCSPDSNTEGSDNKQSGTQQETQKQAPQSPQDVAKEFLDSFIIDKDLKKSYSYFSASDKSAKSQEMYIKEKNHSGIGDFAKGISEYEIKSSKIEPDKATFSVDITTIDTEKIFMEATSGKSLIELAALNEDQALQLIGNKLSEYKKNGTPIPTAIQTEDVELVLEKGNWKVFADWANPNKDKDTVKSVSLNIGEKGVLMSDKEKGDVEITVDSVKFTSVGAEKDMVNCIIGVTIYNNMKNQFTESIVDPLATSAIYSSDGSKYKREFFPASELNSTQVDVLTPLNPGKTKSGDLVFPIDKNAKGLKLSFDTGYHPVKGMAEHTTGKRLDFILGDVSL